MRLRVKQAHARSPVITWLQDSRIPDISIKQFIRGPDQGESTEIRSLGDPRTEFHNSDTDVPFTPKPWVIPAARAQLYVNP